MDKVTLVLGASPNPERYSNRAVRSLRKRGYPVIAVGLREALIDDVPIVRGKPENTGPVHTIGLYIGPANQPGYYDFIMNIRPERIIFNPGTWNPEFAGLARKAGIEVVDDCMLAMLSCGKF